MAKTKPLDELLAGLVKIYPVTGPELAEHIRSAYPKLGDALETVPEPPTAAELHQQAYQLLERAATLAQSIYLDDRETGWCVDVARDIRTAMAILGEVER